MPPTDTLSLLEGSGCSDRVCRSSKVDGLKSNVVCAQNMDLIYSLAIILGVPKKVSSGSSPLRLHYFLEHPVVVLELNTYVDESIILRHARPSVTDIRVYCTNGGNNKEY